MEGKSFVLRDVEADLRAVGTASGPRYSIEPSYVRSPALFFRGLSPTAMRGHWTPLSGCLRDVAEDLEDVGLVVRSVRQQ